MLHRLKKVQSHRAMQNTAYRTLSTKKLHEKRLKPTKSGSWPSDISPSLLGEDAPGSRPMMKDGLALLQKQAALDEYLRGILEAQTRIYDVCKETDLQYAPAISSLLENDVYIKREDQQPVFSFKIRGSYNKIAQLSPERREKGIVACSAGNHAQGVALTCNKLGIDGIIVMPLATPSIKVDAVRKYGGNVKLHGENYDQAQAEAMRLAKEEGRTLIHPFDDPEVICGQGTIGMEILKQIPNKDIHAIFACVGGGGLLAGVSAYTKRVSPSIKAIGVEAKDAAALTRSLEAGEPITLDSVGLFADGAAVRRIGTNTFNILNDLCDGMITSTTDEICAAIKVGFNDTRCVLEPAGALSIAGLIKYVKQTGIKGKTLVAIASGANMDFDRLRFVSERADLSEALISITIPEKPGAFWDLYQTIYPRAVTGFSYRMVGGSKDANIIMSFQSPTSTDKEEIIYALNEKDFKATDLANNEVAKTHARHLAGGRAPDITDERIFRFEFPERPGALRDFLATLREENKLFNVSLFHYRNHGSDVGRVLVGLQVPSEHESQLQDFLEKIDFVNVEETGNDVYQQFLR